MSSFPPVSKNPTAGDGVPGLPPQVNPSAAALLHLSPTVSQEAFDAAWIGNGAKFAPVDAESVVKALVAFYQKRWGHSYDQAWANARREHPLLFNFWEETGRQKKGAPQGMKKA